MLAGEKLDQIKQLFLSETAKAGNPTGMALFIRHESEGRLHCEVKVYFPPTTANLAKSVFGKKIAENGDVSASSTSTGDPQDKIADT